MIIKFSDGRFWHRFNGKVTRSEHATKYRHLREAQESLIGRIAGDMSFIKYPLGVTIFRISEPLI